MQLALTRLTTIAGAGGLAALAHDTHGQLAQLVLGLVVAAIVATAHQLPSSLRRALAADPQLQADTARLVGEALTRLEAAQTVTKP